MPDVEVQLQYVLDLWLQWEQQTGDYRAIRDYLSLLRHIALNLWGQDKSTKASVAFKRKKAGWDAAFFLRILAQ